MNSNHGELYDAHQEYRSTSDHADHIDIYHPNLDPSNSSLLTPVNNTELPRSRPIEDPLSASPAPL
jgi:hypothetical protein